MNVKRPVKWMSGAALSILFAFTMPVQAEANTKTMILAGSIGKSSSASARITLVIPPRPNKTKQQSGAEQASAKKPVENSKQ